MSSIITTLDNIQLKLSNLDKVLWPDDGITKAEIIQYYLAVWPFMEPLVKGRPLTLIRYPDGIHSKRFYSKNAPDHTPDWIPTLAIDDIKYIHIQKSADLVYAANLAALELHMMTVRAESMAYPDTIISIPLKGNLLTISKIFAASFTIPSWRWAIIRMSRRAVAKDCIFTSLFYHNIPASKW
jgi:hypothetical protein